MLLLLSRPTRAPHSVIALHSVILGKVLMQVLEDNIYEQRSRRQPPKPGAGDQAAASNAAADHAPSASALPQMPEARQDTYVESMETDQEAAPPRSTQDKAPGVIQPTMACRIRAQAIILRRSKSRTQLKSAQVFWEYHMLAAKSFLPCARHQAAAGPEGLKA